MPADDSRLARLLAGYPRLHLVVVGDICLDRYLDIDPALQETSIETGLPVHGVSGIRSLPGAGGTVLNNLVALGVGTIDVVGFRGEDGEGWELQRALERMPGVRLEHFLASAERRTFCYTKPLVHVPGGPPRELERLDIKNRSRTPASLGHELAQRLEQAAEHADALVVMEQVDHVGTGAITDEVLASLARIAERRPQLVIIADSRLGLGRYPRVLLKMNAAELGRMLGLERAASLEQAREQASSLARSHMRAVVVTLAEQGLVAADADGATVHVPALPVHGPIDVVGAGDSVTANVGAALAAGATLAEAGALAMAAASIVIHQLGTTGTADPQAILALLPGRRQA